MTTKANRRKSSHSSSAVTCVEVATLPWRKSSHSNGNGGSNCVEVAPTKPRGEGRDQRVA
jgi:hypothetical protein